MSILDMASQGKSFHLGLRLPGQALPEVSKRLDYVLSSLRNIPTLLNRKEYMHQGLQGSKLRRLPTKFPSQCFSTT